ncbi:DMT family transporter [Halarcobacter ebronensis]|uniref:EamA family transporter n=1 Tax=Halarcobacter ebronensis TaxID=1462615 RepID=A0A4Q1AFT2_9BACT|nr:DMT family transporter [Halarcobacter ebronensis]QKF83064.1 DMT family transporter [Halarcobacter ebronensis]RXK02419.1 EamA family transporter [Halarcobacter ebronensis]
MNYVGFLLLTFAMFIWGSSFIALKIAMIDMQAFSVIFFRMLIASLCFLYFIKDFMKFNFTKRNIKFLILLAFFEPCLYFIFEAKALQLTSVSQAGMITSLLPIIVGVAAGFFLKEKITFRLLLGSFIALLGTVILSSNATASQSAPNPILGNFLEFLAMACGAGYTIVARYLTKEFSALFITAFQVFIGTIFFFPIFIYEFSTNDINFTLNSVLALFYLGVVVTLAGYGLYNYALTKVEASKAAIFIYLIPVFALVLANLILDEKVSFVELLASFIILFGVFVSEFKIKKLKRKRA